MRSLRTLVRDIVLNGMVASFALPRGLRWRVLRALGMDVQRSSINAHVFLGGRGISIGRDVFVNYDVFIDNAAPVSIGDRVSFGQGVRIVTGTHTMGTDDRRAGPYTSAPVRVEEGAWVGAYATLLPGVTVGRGALVAAGALVTKDVPPDTLVAGVPAAIVRELPPLEQMDGIRRGDDAQGVPGSRRA
jgi:acetyltransferase-like isoleucine patch superfamily enzyme